MIPTQNFKGELILENSILLFLESLLKFLFNKVHQIQCSRPTKGRRLLNEVCVINVRGSDNK